MNVWITHGYYGCDTGCCGHYVEAEGDTPSVWFFAHPWRDTPEARREWAENLAKEAAEKQGWGPVEIDWTRCSITDD